MSKFKKVTMISNLFCLW